MVQSDEVIMQRGSPSHAQPQFLTPMVEKFTTPLMVHSSPSLTPSAPPPSSSTTIALTHLSNALDASCSIQKKTTGFFPQGNTPTSDKNDASNFKARCLSLGKMNVGVGGPDN